MILLYQNLLPYQKKTFNKNDYITILLEIINNYTTPLNIFEKSKYLSGLFEILVGKKIYNN